MKNKKSKNRIKNFENKKKNNKQQQISPTLTL